MNLPKAERAGLRINGEPIADLDFASMFPRLAYARLGLEPPEGDLYALPGLERHRAGAKAGMSALLSTASEMKRLTVELKAALPQSWNALRLRNAASYKHPALAPLFGTDLALDLMFAESNILVAAMLDLMRRGVAALPMHDGILVTACNAIVAKRAMERAALRITGVRISVVRKTIHADVTSA